MSDLSDVYFVGYKHTEIFNKKIQNSSQQFFEKIKKKFSQNYNILHG